MKKKIIYVLAVLGCAVLLTTACSLFSAGQVGISSEMLKADKDGHFEEDATYTYYEGVNAGGSYVQRKRIETFGADGTYTYYDYYYEEDGLDLNENGTADEGYVEVYGIKATYTYDNDTKKITRNNTEILNEDSGYQWNENNPVVTYRVLVFENFLKNAFEKTDSTLTWVWSEDHPDGDESDYTYTETFSLSADGKTLTITTLGEKLNPEYKLEETIVVEDTKPSGIVFNNMEDAETITFSSNRKEWKSWSWDEGAGEFVLDDEGTSIGWQTVSFTKVGDYYTWGPINLDRNIY